MSERITNYSVGRRWRCQRSHSVSFDFVIVGPGAKGDSKRCRLELLPGQESWLTKNSTDLTQLEQDYTHSHLRRVAVLQPISLDDIARSI